MIMASIPVKLQICNTIVFCTLSFLVQYAVDSAYGTDLVSLYCGDRESSFTAVEEDG